MPDFVRIEDSSTGAKSTVGRKLGELYERDGVARIIDEPAVHAVLGTPLAPQPGTTAAQATYSGRKADELRAELEQRNLPTSGNKADLIERLGADDASKGDLA